ncbi:hypothetical protein A2U01_0028821 [Trifolium medium]|uniref:Uncharacterized protein n=1 Tax=Trifolium medium TaxID=97028 RepID=A0A392P7Q0_9FABA|nr:hypothetical protein [Trifolium medium]
MTRSWNLETGETPCREDGQDDIDERIIQSIQIFLGDVFGVKQSWGLTRQGCVLDTIFGGGGSKVELRAADSYDRVYKRTRRQGGSGVGVHVSAHANPN